MAIARQNESLMQIKTNNAARESYAQQHADRKRNAIVLFLTFLRQEGYVNSVVQIENDTNITLNNYQACDNVDILNVISEYETYYQYKFDKPVKLVRKCEAGENKAPQVQNRSKSSREDISKPNLPKPIHPPQQQQNSSQNQTPNEPKKPDPKSERRSAKSDEPDLKIAPQLPQITAIPISDSQVKQVSANPMGTKIEPDEETFRPILAAPPQNFPPELLSFYYIIQHEILTEHPTSSFKEVVGLEKPKQILRESVILPAKYPDLFQGILKPWKGCLLFSAPGNGKSFLARALAAECRCTFFNISASSLLSKYYGESEKMVRSLFIMARQYERSVIFIDELDCLMTARSDDSEHEASRRLKTQLLVEIDGLSSNTSSNQVFVLAATNLPWTIDSAMLRRLEKRVYVNAPEQPDRMQMITQLIGDRIVQKELIEEMAKQTEHWSASDVCALCKEAAMSKLRKVLQNLEKGEKYEQQNLRVGREEVQEAQKNVKPSYDIKMQEKYQKWSDEYGA